MRSNKRINWEYENKFIKVNLPEKITVRKRNLFDTGVANELNFFFNKSREKLSK